MKRRHRAFVISGLALGALSVSVPAAAIELPRSVARLSADDFASRIAVDDDPLEASVIMTSKGTRRAQVDAKGATVEQSYVEARIDRGSNVTSWSISYRLAYVGPVRDIRAVHYLVDGALRQTRPTRIEHYLDGCPATDAPGQCHQVTSISFQLPESDLRRIAATFVPASREAWLIRFKASNDKSVTVGFPPAEISGLLASYDNVLQRHVKPEA